ncbi:MAG: hypothetical protein IPJ74_16930 [Saprospiraceae bacterium]|nr:hypothetical protein [Saprospiraceae bacterium]
MSNRWRTYGTLHQGHIKFYQYIAPTEHFPPAADHSFISINKRNIALVLRTGRPGGTSYR